MSGILLVMWILVRACDSSGGIRHQLRVADDKICEMLKNPTYETAGLIIRTIKEFNEKLLKLSRQVESPKNKVNPQKRIIRVGELVLKYRPKFTNMKIDGKKLKKCLHWDDRSIKYVKHLVRRSTELRVMLYKRCKRNYKYYMPQEYYEPRQDFEQQQYNKKQEYYEQEQYYEGEYYDQAEYYERTENASEKFIKINQ